VRTVSGPGASDSSAAMAANDPTPVIWSDWIADDLTKRGWKVDGDEVTTDRPMQGFNILPADTGDAAIRVTYRRSDSAGVQISARDIGGDANGKRVYLADDGGDALYVAADIHGVVKNLQSQKLPAGAMPTGEHTLEFRVVGVALTATLDGTMTLSARDDTFKQGAWALVIRKGVRVTKLEHQLPRK
jgi:hypothetical protein